VGFAEAVDAEEGAEAAAHGKSLRSWSLQAGSGRISLSAAQPQGLVSSLVCRPGNNG